MKRPWFICIGMCMMILLQACSEKSLLENRSAPLGQTLTLKWDHLSSDQSPSFYSWSEYFILQAVQEKILPVEKAVNAAQVVTRGEFLEWLIKTANIKGRRGKVPFHDIQANHPLFRFVQIGYSSGILTSSERFEPDKPLMRSEASIWLIRSLGERAISLAETFTEPRIPAQDGYYEVPKEAAGSMTVCYLPAYQLMYYRWYKNDEYRYIAPNDSMMIFEAAYSLMMIKHPPVKGGSLVIGQQDEPKTLFAELENTVEVNKAISLMETDLYEGLDENWCYFPILIKQIPTFKNGLWKIIETNGQKKMKMRFELHKGLKWSDGSDLTAKDVVFGTYLYLHPVFPGHHSDQEAWIEKIEALDPYTVEVTWDRFFLFANHRFMRIMPVHFFEQTLQKTLLPYSLKNPRYYDASKDNPTTEEDESYRSPQYLADVTFIQAVVQSSFNEKPVYAGPYRLKEWQKNVMMVLEPNEYYLYGSPLIEKITFLTIKGSEEFSQSSDVLLAAILAGKVDMTIKDLSLEQAFILQKRHTSHHPFFPASMKWEYLVLNTDDPILSQKKIRQALLYGIDRKTILQEWLGGVVVPADTWFPPLHFATRSAEWFQYEYNPEKAKELLFNAGWKINREGRLTKEGKVLTITLLTTSRNNLREQVLRAIAAYWNELGINTNIQLVDHFDLLDKVLPGRQFSGPTAVMIANDQAPDYNSYFSIHSECIPTKENNQTGMNYAGYKSKEMDAWLEASENASTKAAYWDAMQKMQVVLIQDLPCLPLYFYPMISSADEDLQNFKPSGSYSFSSWNAAHWFWKTLKNHEK